MLKPLPTCTCPQTITGEDAPRVRLRDRRRMIDSALDGLESLYFFDGVAFGWGTCIWTTYLLIVSRSPSCAWIWLAETLNEHCIFKPRRTKIFILLVIMTLTFIRQTSINSTIFQRDVTYKFFSKLIMRLINSLAVIINRGLNAPTTCCPHSCSYCKALNIQVRLCRVL